MKEIRNKAILLILCFTMLSGTVSLGFARAELSTASPGSFTQTIVVFDHKISNWDHPAVETITIPDWPILSVEMFLQAKCDPNDWYLRAIHFDVDGALGPPPRAGIGGAINCWRLSGSQVRGDPSGIPPSGTISPGQTKTYTFDMSHVYLANPPEGPYGSYQKPWKGRFYHNYIPQFPGDILGYFSPGEHTITSFVSSQDATGGPNSWVTIILTITYAFMPVEVEFNPDTLNRKSQGKWVTVYIELSDGYTWEDIDISTIKLNGVVPAEEKPTGIDEDGILMVKFDRELVRGLLGQGENVLITISGALFNGINFEGTDTIRVIH